MGVGRTHEMIDEDRDASLEGGGWSLCLWANLFYMLSMQAYLVSGGGERTMGGDSRDA